MMQHKLRGVSGKRVRLFVALLVLLGWLGLAGVGGPYFGKIEEVSSNDPATFLPASAESTQVREKLKEFQDTSTLPAIVVFEAKDILSEAQVSQLEQVRDNLGTKEIAKGQLSPPLISDDKKAAYIIVPLDSSGDIPDMVAQLRKQLDNVRFDSISYSLTGPAVFSDELREAFTGIDGTLLIVALSVVFVILIFVYRTPVLPVVTLVSAMVALASAVVVVWHLADAGIVQLNGQVQGILFILVIGAATDYALLYIARYREELTRHKDPWEATKKAWRASVEPVLAAGGTVTVGLLCLLVSDLGSNKALGPVGGIGIAFSIAATLTFLPTALWLLGRKAFWPQKPAVLSVKQQANYRKDHPVWSRVSDLVSKHPRRLWVGIMALLIVACLWIPQLKADGVSQDNFVLGQSEARDGQKVIDRHFPAGSGSPAQILTPAADLNSTITLLEADEGVDSVTIMTTDKEKPNAPVGISAQELTDSITLEIQTSRDVQLAQLRQSIASQLEGAPSTVIEDAYSQAAAKVPSVQELSEKANPFHGLTHKEIDGVYVLMATLTDAASSVEARQTIERLRATIQVEHPGVQFGGESAIQLDTNDASAHDLMVIIPLVLVAITVILMVLLRSVVAPLLLLFTTVVSFGSTMGVAALLFNHVWGFPGADPAVVIYGFVFLVALGIDYNIFLMTRVREETKQLGVRSGTLKALVVTGGVITSAGVVLAATFAALAVIPILFLAQIAFIVAFGVLLDTLIVRSLLVPALTLEVGRPMWWPSRIWRHGKK